MATDMLACTTFGVGMQTTVLFSVWVVPFLPLPWCGVHSGCTPRGTYPTPHSNVQLAGWPETL